MKKFGSLFILFGVFVIFCLSGALHVTAEEYPLQFAQRTEEELKELRSNLPEGAVLLRDLVAADSQTDVPGISPYVTITSPAQNVLFAQGHVQSYGWSPRVDTNKYMIGTTGRSLRLEAFVLTCKYPIQYRAHVQDKGWQPWGGNGSVAGTTGQKLRMEAIQIKGLKGFEILYRTHIQNKGWSKWSKNGQTSGTTGQKLRIEAIDIEPYHTFEF